MTISRSLRLVRKAKSSMLAAIEIFNKPSFTFREETFAVLALTAWELLLKAKLVSDADNDLDAILVKEPIRKKDGSAGSRKVVRKSRSGQPYTIDLVRAIGVLDADSQTRLPDPMRDNIYGLMEIRDNSCHFYNTDDDLAGIAVQFGMACVNNFVLLAKKWFEEDFSGELTLLMAIGFLGGARKGVGVPIGSSAELVKCLKALATGGAREVDGCVVVLEMEVSTKRGERGTGHVVQIANDSNAPALQLTQEDIGKSWPLTYDSLVDTCRDRYTDFKQNAKFNTLLRRMKGDRRYHFVVRLDPDNPKSAKKDRYNQNVFQILDPEYSRKR